ncbi:hypothetical protein SAMN05660226_00545 [Parapedobacter luteus]|uniref:Uncharacterized protein n=1 Tax=Parapedobacter luteus TaxID=623280 RepID=A0A1T5A3L9_9SPHI|nr:hypothetical protein SAMN05660226_00545 [Parapedobacter luteus]
MSNSVCSTHQIKNLEKQLDINENKFLRNFKSPSTRQFYFIARDTSIRQE